MKWIYLMDVLPTLSAVCAILAVLTIIIALTYLIYCNESYGEKFNPKSLVACITIFLVFAMTSALIPGKRAIAIMAVESGVTNDQIKDIASGWLKVQ